MPLWIILVLINVLLLSVFYLSTKKLLNDGHDPVLYGGMMQLITAVFGYGIVFFTGFHFVLTTHSILFLLLEGVIYACAASMYYSGLKHVELSHSIVLETSTAFWSLAAGYIFLHEPLTLFKILGTLCIFFGIIIVSLKKKIDTKFTKYDFLILASAIFYALGAVVDKYLIGFADVHTYLAVSFTMPGTIILLSNFNRLPTVGLSMLRKGKFRLLLCMSSLFVTMAYTAYFYAYKLGGQVSVMYPLTQLQTIIISLIGIVFLNEKKDLKKKFIAALFAFAGLIFLSL